MLHGLSRKSDRWEDPMRSRGAARQHRHFRQLPPGKSACRQQSRLTKAALHTERGLRLQGDTWGENRDWGLSGVHRKKERRKGDSPEGFWSRWGWARQ